MAKNPVAMFDSDNNLVAKFESIRDAARKTGFNNGNISLVCNGNKQSICGFIFKFIETRTRKETIV
jgi:hypothetical protein